MRMTHEDMHVYQAHCFFFQAEDGIRDSSVTGVQTCALPICDEIVPMIVLQPAEVPSAVRPRRDTPVLTERLRVQVQARLLERGRSEERRVGKECRIGWWRADGRRRERESTQQELSGGNEG